MLIDNRQTAPAVALSLFEIITTNWARSAKPLLFFSLSVPLPSREIYRGKLSLSLSHFFGAQASTLPNLRRSFL